MLIRHRWLFLAVGIALVVAGVLVHKTPLVIFGAVVAFVARASSGS